MRIDYSPYQLNPTDQRGPRRGALIRVTFPDGSIGYSDLHPWTEMGDVPLEQQLGYLKANHPTDLAKQTLWLAKRDAEARQVKRNLIDEEIRLKNNYLFSRQQEFSSENLNNLVRYGFSILKLKIGEDLERDLNAVKKIASTRQFQLRLDFNMKSDLNDFENFFKKLTPSEKTLIQYVEDPFPYGEGEWKQARQITKIAADFATEQFEWTPEKSPECDVIIVKPARRNIEQTIQCLKAWRKPFTVTSNLDHVLGVAHAISVAQLMDRSLPNQMLDPGCFTFVHYETEPYSAALKTKGPYFLKQDGCGVGFDLLLDRESWKPLCE